MILVRVIEISYLQKRIDFYVRLVTTMQSMSYRWVRGVGTTAHRTHHRLEWISKSAKYRGAFLKRTRAPSNQDLTDEQLPVSLNVLYCLIRPSLFLFVPVTFHNIEKSTPSNKSPDKQRMPHIYYIFNYKEQWVNALKSRYIKSKLEVRRNSSANTWAIIMASAGPIVTNFPSSEECFQPYYISL